MLFYAHADNTHQSTHLGKRKLVKASTVVLKTRVGLLTNKVLHGFHVISAFTLFGLGNNGLQGLATILVLVLMPQSWDCLDLTGLDNLTRKGYMQHNTDFPLETIIYWHNSYAPRKPLFSSSRWTVWYSKKWRVCLWYKSVSIARGILHLRLILIVGLVRIVVE